MNVTRQEDGQFELRMEEEEWRSLCQLLSQYPLTPADHHSLNSKNNPDPGLKESDQWLRDSVSKHQTDRELQIKQWIQGIEPVDSDEGHLYPVLFDAERADWLIEILNDLRVGSWMSLNCPAPETLSDKSPDSEEWPRIWIMEVSGMNQSILLQALS